MKQIKYFFSLVLPLFFLSVLPCHAQTNHADSANVLTEAFKTLPDSLMPYLSENNRLDLLDFHAAGMKAQVTNQFDGTTMLMTLTADSLSLQLTPVSTFTLILMPLSEPVQEVSQLVCIVKTLQSAPGVYDQTAQCFTPQWQPVADSLLPPDILRRVALRRHSTLLSTEDRQWEQYRKIAF